VNGCIVPAGDARRIRECLLRATDAGNNPAWGANSAAVLADWRQRADPIAGLRLALRSVTTNP
jgi:hypothetical protein